MYSCSRTEMPGDSHREIKFVLVRRNTANFTLLHLGMFCIENDASFTAIAI